VRESADPMADQAPAPSVCDVVRSRDHWHGAWMFGMAIHTDEHESRQVAEEAREREWTGRGFLRDVFLGKLHYDWIDPFPETAIRPHAREFLARFRAFLETEVDSARIDATGEYPPHVLERLSELGAFGMKIDTEYGGLGFNTLEYARALELCAQYDGNLVALLSAHQSIGVPQPLAIFGTPEQKRKYLPPCARGVVSAFALTESDVGSDPARLAATATRTPEGDYILDGEKLWCTNGTIAKLFIVMARHPDTKRISAFVVEGAFQGVEVLHRCRFMGLRAIENGVIRFDRVRVPRENLVGREGDGLRIALVTLNTGRLSLPAACVGLTKRCTEIVRTWSNERVQWGRPIGHHEAIAQKLGGIGASTYAIESMTLLATELSLKRGYDIRLEAAAAKEWATTEAWRIVDDTMQIRGGRGYETEQSLAARGERPIGVERMMRDSRINLIFEGSSEIMHLFMAREAVDRHLEIAGALVDPKKSTREKLAALPRVVLFYLTWFPRLWFGIGAWLRYGRLGRFAPQLRYADRVTRKLARSIFYGMLVYRASLERRQAFLFRIVDVGNLVFAMSASVARARALLSRGDPAGDGAAELAEAFCSSAEQRIERHLGELWRNDDREMTRFSRHVLEGRYEWMEDVYAGPGMPIPTGLVRAPAAESGFHGLAGERRAG